MFTEGYGWNYLMMKCGEVLAKLCLCILSPTLWMIYCFVFYLYSFFLHWFNFVCYSILFVLLYAGLKRD